MKIIYNKNTGKIIGQTTNEDVDPAFVFARRGKEFTDKLDTISIDKKIDDVRKYIIHNDKIVKRPQQEIDEIEQYGKILSENERVLNKLRPSRDEVKKAKQTIEILTLLQEVM